jgi:hypothetical protein
MSPGGLKMPTSTSLQLASEAHSGTGMFGNRLHFCFGTCLHTIQTVTLISLLATLSSLQPSLLFAPPPAWLFVHLHKRPCARRQGQMAALSCSCALTYLLLQALTNHVPNHLLRLRNFTILFTSHNSTHQQPWHRRTQQFPLSSV